MSYYQQCDGDSSTFCRHDLLNWLNSTLSLRMNRVEDTCNGAAFCQVIDILHPNSINLGKVNFNARDSYEREKNYKILQQAFTKAGINKTLEVDRYRITNNQIKHHWYKTRSARFIRITSLLTSHHTGTLFTSFISKFNLIKTN